MNLQEILGTFVVESNNKFLALYPIAPYADIGEYETRTEAENAIVNFIEESGLSPEIEK